MKKVIKTLLRLSKIFLALIIALIILSGVCFAFSYSGVRVHNNDGATDFKWLPNQYKSTALEGYAWFTMDKNGYNNYCGTDKSPDILFMGSSHLEGANVMPCDNMCNIVREQTSYSVYNIGTSGHTIYNCVANLEYALSVYTPDKYVVIETDTVDLSADTMSSVTGNSLSDIQSYDSGLLFLAQKYIPPLKTIYKNIGDFKDADKITQEQSAQTSSTTPVTTEYTDALNSFLNKAKSSALENDCSLIIFYHPRATYDENGNFVTTTDTDKLNAFKNTCKNNDIIFIDMTSTYQTNYEQNDIFPRGFSNTEVSGGHLNEYGHYMIAQQIIKAIQEDN